MKKLFQALLPACLACLLLCSCGGAASSAKTIDLSAVMSAIEAVAPVTVPADMNDEYLTGMYGISMSDVVEYKGKYSNVNISSDEILIVHAASGKADTIKTACENRRKAKADQCAMYLADQATKAENGRIVVSGDTVIFVVAGDDARIQKGEVDAVYAEIDKAISGALA